MPATSFIVVSDLHLADGHDVLEGFGARQQDALDGLLQAALPGGALGDQKAATLIINGDCFDFLALPPYLENGYITPAIALTKLEKVANAHQNFFRTLNAFLSQGGQVVFLPGNHDIELCFKEVRTQVTRLIGQEQGLHFVLNQSYQPWPDVYIEHGSQYDFWNYVTGVWDKQGNASSEAPESILLPLGTQYMHRATFPISLRYPYFDHFDPPIGTTRQIALLSLLDPALLVKTAQSTANMMSSPYSLPEGNESPAQLFEQTMPAFVAFQQEMLEHFPDWQSVEEAFSSPEDREQSQARALSEFFTLRLALEQSSEAALQAIFQPISTPVADDTTRGMHTILNTRPDLRVAVAGHTHVLRSDSFDAGKQIYLNTASWITRYAPPTPEQLTPEILAWLRQPDMARFPFQDKSGCVFAWIRAQTGQPSTASLYSWEGGKDGSYKVLDQ